MKKCFFGVLAYTMSFICLVSLSCKKKDADLLNEEKGEVSWVSIKYLQDQIDQINKSISEINEERIRPHIEIDPTSMGYQTLLSNNGPLLVMPNNIQPFGDGQKITLEIGNPQFIAYDGIKISCVYGARMPDPEKTINTIPQTKKEDSESDEKIGGVGENDQENEFSGLLKWWAQIDEWKKTLVTKEFNISNRILPGQWNKISFVIAPASPQDVVYLKIKISTNKVILSRD